MSSLRKHTQNLIIDSISFLFLILLLTTGFIIHYVLPPGSHGETWMSLGRHDWGDIHFWLAIVFSSIILLHLILHYSWIKASILPKNPSKRRKVVLLIMLLIYGIVVLAGTNIF